jgi:carboxymethylenebutenolidase
MWNRFRTDDYEGMLAETVSYPSRDGGSVRAYLARPLGKGPFPGVVLVPHMPGWDEFYRETTRRFAQHGYQALCPDIFRSFGTGTPEEVAQRARAAGGVSDDAVMGDCDGAVQHLRNAPNANARVGVIGTCSGGRHAFLAACRLQGIDAAVDCWGGRVVAAKEELTPACPVAPIDCTKDLSCPLLGIFGNEDRFPPPEQVDRLEQELIACGKDYRFHRYDGAGHGFWYYHAEAYRPKQAMDAWQKVFEFFEEHLRTRTDP